MTSPSPEGPASGSPLIPDLARFDRGERVLHWLNATLFAVVMATALGLYVPAISAVVGRRETLKTIHVWSGLALPVPVAVTWCLRSWGSGFRADVRRFNRWSAADRRWLVSWGRDPFVEKGKFNSGQKLNAAFTGGAIAVMLGTGSIMRWTARFPLAWRTGATFVHDWVFFVVFFAISGHVWFATRDPEALRSMVNGRISSQWARRHAPRWYREMTQAGCVPPSSPAGAPFPQEQPADSDPGRL